jgi:hypothetical protein
MSRRSTAVTVGCLFVVQMLAAAVGYGLAQGFLDGDSGLAALRVGVLLMLSAGIAVASIGLLMYPILRPVDRRLAMSYAVLRIVELAVTAVCGIYLLARLELVPHYLLWVYVPTGIGGLVLTYLLFVSRLVPRPVAVLGLIGYACLTIGVPLDLLGVLDMGTGAGQALLVPGGLFEVAVLPAWLIAKGFAPYPQIESGLFHTKVAAPG